jgi:hypothetical protein
MACNAKIRFQVVLDESCKHSESIRSPLGCGVHALAQCNNPCSSHELHCLHHALHVENELIFQKRGKVYDVFLKNLLDNALRILEQNAGKK